MAVGVLILQSKQLLWTCARRCTEAAVSGLLAFSTMWAEGQQRAWQYLRVVPYKPSGAQRKPGPTLALKTSVLSSSLEPISNAGEAKVGGTASFEDVRDKGQPRPSSGCFGA